MKLATADGRITSRGIQALSLSRPGPDFRSASIPLRAFAIALAFQWRPAAARAFFLLARQFKGYFCASTASAMALAVSLADILGSFTNAVIVSMIAPRYFCRMVMLWAIERTRVPPAMEACRSFCDICWQALKPLLRSTSRRAGIEPFAW